MIGLLVIFVGAALVTAGLVVMFGAPAMVACGLILTAAGVVVDWEAVHGKYPAPPSG